MRWGLAILLLGVSCADDTSGVDGGGDRDAGTGGAGTNPVAGSAAASAAFTSVSAGSFHTCGVRKSDGHVLCWGDDTYSLSTPPADVPFSSVSAGSQHVCAVRESGGIAVCWGAYARNLWK